MKAIRQKLIPPQIASFIDTAPKPAGAIVSAIRMDYEKHSEFLVDLGKLFQEVVATDVPVLVWDDALTALSVSEKILGNVRMLEGSGEFRERFIQQLAHVGAKSATQSAKHFMFIYLVGKFLLKYPPTAHRPKEVSDRRTLPMGDQMTHHLKQAGMKDRRIWNKWVTIAEWIPAAEFKQLIEEANPQQGKAKEPLTITDLLDIAQEQRGKTRRAVAQSKADAEFYGSKKNRKAYADNCRIEHCDFMDLKLTGSPVLKGEKPAAIITDPPYKDEFFEKDKSGRWKGTSLWGRFAKWAHDVLAPDGTVVVMVGTKWLDQCIKTMLDAKWEYRWCLVVEYLDVPYNHGQRVKPYWKPVLAFKRHGDKIPRESNISGDRFKAGKRIKVFGEWQQEPETFVRIVNYFAPPKSLVCDPFGGFGTTAVSCMQTARRFIGSEIFPLKNPTAEQIAAGAAEDRRGICVAESQKAFRERQQEAVDGKKRKEEEVVEAMTVGQLLKELKGASPDTEVHFHNDIGYDVPVKHVALTKDDKTKEKRITLRQFTEKEEGEAKN